MDPLVLSVISLALSCVNSIGVILGIHWHCRNDDKRAGIMEERTEENRRRIEALERRGGIGWT